MSENSFPANWYQDPTGRHEQRYYDGTAWTDQVVSGGVQQSDPMVAAPSLASAATGADGPLGSAGTFLESLGAVAHEREEPELPMALGGLGGALVGSGLLTLIAQSESQGAIIGGSVVILALAFAAALKLLGDQPWLRTAATALCSIGIFGLTGGLILAGDAPGENAPGLFLLLAGLLHLGAWVVVGFRGRPFMLGGGIIATSLGLALLLAGGDDNCGFDDFFSTGCNPFQEFFGQFGLSTAAGVVMLVIGCALLFLVRKLDTANFHGTAETVAAGAIGTLLFGALALSIDLGAVGNSLLVIAVGLGMGIIGHQGGRRALTWTGAALIASGVISLATNVLTTDDTTVGSILLITLGAALIAVPRFIQLQLANRQSG